MTRTIFWFRNDLRLEDNPGLAAAVSKGEALLVYVLDNEPARQWGMGGARSWWLHHSLQSLQKDIAGRGGKLHLRRGDAVKIIPELAVQIKASEVHAGRGVEPRMRAQEQAIDAGLQSAGIGFHLHLSFLLFPPARITTRTGGIYGVYTPFSNACFAQAPKAKPIAAPASLADPKNIATDDLDDWQLLPTQPDWAGGLRESWAPGEAGAKIRLRNFLNNALAGYKEARNIPAEEGTSRLSPHLHFGEISAASIWHAAEQKNNGPGLETFLRELIWREFSNYLLWHHPKMPDQPLRPEFEKFPWANDTQSLKAWQRGQTGIPIVDAAMRQLWRTGWMHNRMRMVCASFLVKHLLIPWQTGEAWFWDTLVDADLGNNSNNWQWVAGCGADAAPYFRIFNPVLQGQKFDPKGDYVRAYVPELAQLPNQFIHAPWEADAAALAGANVTLGETYRHPIVDLARGRDRALAAFRKIKSSHG